MVRRGAPAGSGGRVALAGEDLRAHVARVDLDSHDRDHGRDEDRLPGRHSDSTSRQHASGLVTTEATQDAHRASDAARSVKERQGATNATRPTSLRAAACRAAYKPKQGGPRATRRTRAGSPRTARLKLAGVSKKKRARPRHRGRGHRRRHRRHHSARALRRRGFPVVRPRDRFPQRASLGARVGPGAGDLEATLSGAISRSSPS